jgi:glycosyltransferase involved in cell wall biosynthesis
MKVIFANREDCLINRGGDTNQMLLTQKYLESTYNDIQIELCFDPKELSKKECDIIHIFNLATLKQSIKFVQAAKSTKSKIVLSSIYWNYETSIIYNIMAKFIVSSPSEKTKLLRSLILFLLKYFKKGSEFSKGFVNDIKYIINSSDIVLPNSSEEQKWLESLFNIKFNSTIVPNAIEITDNNIGLEQNEERNLIIQAGLIIPSKNQLNTLLATMDIPEYPLYFIGRIGNNKYYKHLVKYAKKRGNVFFTGELKNNELADYYKKALVHVLPSLGESTGLVTIEALYYGCEVVVSDKRFAPVDYYQMEKIGHICNPLSVSSINDAIVKAIQFPKYNEVNTNCYFEFYNYNTVAKKTFEAYKSILLK